MVPCAFNTSPVPGTRHTYHFQERTGTIPVRSVRTVYVLYTQVLLRLGLDQLGLSKDVIFIFVSRFREPVCLLTVDLLCSMLALTQTG